eukprot:scaffold107329_cov30-Tisochrysis_lutea.AAC.2
MHDLRTVAACASAAANDAPWSSCHASVDINGTTYRHRYRRPIHRVHPLVLRSRPPVCCVCVPNGCRCQDTFRLWLHAGLHCGSVQGLRLLHWRTAFGTLPASFPLAGSGETSDL